VLTDGLKLMKIDPLQRFDMSYLRDERFFLVNVHMHGHSNAFDHQRAQSDSWEARLYRPDSAKYSSPRWHRRAALDLVETTDATLDWYDGTYEKAREFYGKFQWINVSTLWTVWSKPAGCVPNVQPETILEA
jgi:hypothetical protein